MKNKMNKDNVSIFFGDSIVYGLNDNELGGWVNRIRLKLEKESKSNFVINLGIPGQTSKDILKRFESELKNRFNEVDKFNLIFSFGIKDSLLLNTDDNYINEFRENLLKIINISNNYTSNIYFIGLIEPKVNIRKEYVLKSVKSINKCIKDICEDNQIRYIKINDVLTKNNLYDGLHPNSVGHQKISELVFEEIYCEEYYEFK